MHRIRLRGSWERSTEGSRTIHCRKFGQPRSLGDVERVWLVCDFVPGAAEVSVNGQAVGATAVAERFAADVTEQLQSRNAVVFAVAGSGELGEVALEIRMGVS